MIYLFLYKVYEVLSESLVSPEIRRGHQIPRTRVTDIYVGSENHGPLEEQQVFSVCELSPSPILAKQHLH